ncbi:hypothetical protein IKF43_01565 [Candidatus Saccharibacteria bacterium]|nr:hypothetical protein [Candidatus Saccharibacteria bacterium]
MKYTAMLMMVLACIGLVVLNGPVAGGEIGAEAADATTTVVATAVAASKEESTTEVTTSEETTNETTTEETTVRETTAKETTTEAETEKSVEYDINANVDGKHYSLAKFRRDGEYYDSSGYKFTWYPETVLPGPGLNIPGRHVNDEGYVCDEDGNICLASTELAKGTVVKIPFGNGIGVVYDKCVTSGRVLDVYIH